MLKKRKNISETSEHNEIKKIKTNLEKWYNGITINEYPNYGQEADAYHISYENHTILIEIIWTITWNQVLRDFDILQNSMDFIKIVVVNPKIFDKNEEDKRKHFDKLRISEIRKGYIVSELFDGLRILNDESYNIYLRDFINFSLTLVSRNEKYTQIHHDDIKDFVIIPLHVERLPPSAAPPLPNGAPSGRSPASRCPRRSSPRTSGRGSRRGSRRAPTRARTRRRGREGRRSRRRVRTGRRAPLARPRHRPPPAPRRSSAGRRPRRPPAARRRARRRRAPRSSPPSPPASQRRPIHHVRRPAPDAAAERASGSRSTSPRRQPPRKGGERPDDAEGVAGEGLHPGIRATPAVTTPSSPPSSPPPSSPPPSSPPSVASRAPWPAFPPEPSPRRRPPCPCSAPAASAWPRLCFSASMRLTTLPRSGAAAMIGLWPLSFSLIIAFSAAS